MPSREPQRVVRVYHSGVVTAWRERDRQLRALGVDLVLLVPRSWDEGGRKVPFDSAGDRFVVPARTLGRHPYLFVFDPVPLWRLLRAAGRGGVDVLDVHEEPASLAVLEVRVLARLAGLGRVPMLLYGAQNLPKRYPLPFRWFERAALRRAAGIYPCSTEAGEILVRKGFRGVVRVLPLGVDTARFAPDGTGHPGGRADGVALHVGYVGRLERHKGVHVLLDALAGLPQVTAEVVGDGPERADLMRQADWLGLGGRVRFVGFAGHDDLPGHYRRFDVLAVPSIPTPSWTEQFGRVAVEAMASGVPVVAAASGSLPEVVGPGGVLVPPGDPLALRDALARLAGDAEERIRLGKLAHEWAQRYSWASVAAGHHELYREVTR